MSLPLLEVVPLVAPDGTAIPYLAYVDRVPDPVVLPNAATAHQLIDVFARLAAGLGLPLIGDFPETAPGSVWVRPPRLYLPTTTQTILCFSWDIWIKHSGFLLELS